MATTSSNIAESASMQTKTSLSEMHAQMFEARWIGSGLDAMHRDSYVAEPDVSTPCGKMQREIMDMPPGFIVGLIGPRGTGKTQIAQNLVGLSIVANLNNLFDRRTFRFPQPRYTSASKIFRALRDAMRRNRDDQMAMSESETMASFVNPVLLVIDEAHERGETDFENRALNEIIDDRYAAKRSTILISNLNKAEFSKSIGPSIVSRIHECGTVFECNWPSFRTAGKVQP